MQIFFQMQEGREYLFKDLQFGSQPPLLHASLRQTGWFGERRK